MYKYILIILCAVILAGCSGMSSYDFADAEKALASRAVFMKKVPGKTVKLDDK